MLLLQIFGKLQGFLDIVTILLKQAMTDLFHMRSQPLFCADKIEKSLLLAFEIESNVLMCSLILFLYENL